MENNINEIKFYKRCIKEDGKYNEFKKIVSANRTINKNKKINYYIILSMLHISTTKYIYQNYGEIIKKEFKQFLKQHNIYDYFFNYVDYSFIKSQIFHQQSKKYNSKEDTLFRNTNFPYAFIRDAFSWEKTKQGHEFWREFNVKWESEYYEIERHIINGTYNK